MKTMRKIELGCYIMVLNLWSFTLVAQEDDPGFPTEDPGTPAAPIDEWIFPMVLLGIAMIVYYTKKKKLTEL